MDQLTSGVRVCHSPSSISGAICRPPVRPQTYRARRLTTTATRGTLVPPTPHRTRRFYRGTPQIDRSVRDRRRFNVYTYIYNKCSADAPTHTCAPALSKPPPSCFQNTHFLHACNVLLHRIASLTVPLAFFFFFFAFPLIYINVPPI